MTGIQFRALRKKLKLNQRELGQKLGVHHETIRRLEATAAPGELYQRAMLSFVYEENLHSVKEQLKQQEIVIDFLKETLNQDARSLADDFLRVKEQNGFLQDVIRLLKVEHKRLRSEKFREK